MVDIQDKKLVVVKRLLAKAEAEGTTREEREALSAKAMRLLTKYGIDAALAHSEDSASDHIETRKYWVPNPYAMDKVTLLHSVAVPLRCKAVYMRQKGRGGKSVYVTGYTSDLDRVEMLYNSLLVQQQRALAQSSGPLPGESRVSYNKSFLHSYCVAVMQRLRQADRSARQAAQETATGTDVVLAHRSVAVDREVKRYWGRTTGSSRRLNGSGGSAGRRAGERADLGGGNGVGGSRRAIGS